jgi:hypothetical protein
VYALDWKQKLIKMYLRSAWRLFKRAWTGDVVSIFIPHPPLEEIIMFMVLPCVREWERPMCLMCVRERETSGYQSPRRTSKLPLLRASPCKRHGSMLCSQNNNFLYLRQSTHTKSWTSPCQSLTTDTEVKDVTYKVWKSALRSFTLFSVKLLAS